MIYHAEIVDFLLPAYAQFLSDGLEVPSCGINVDTLRMRYASLLWNYTILKAQNGYVYDNEDPQRHIPKKAKIDENVAVTTIDQIGGYLYYCELPFC